jgi:Zn-dependent protease with chaperone function
VRSRWTSIRLAIAAVALTLLGACGGVGVDAGGETNGSNGGVAFILLASFLVVGALILWFILGRED